MNAGQDSIKREDQMKVIKSVCLIGIILLIWISCGTENNTFYKKTYILQENVLQAVDSDSLVIDRKSISLIAGADTLKISGELLQIEGNLLEGENGVYSKNMHYILKDSGNSMIAEIRLSDQDTTDGFESIYKTGDISKISKVMGCCFSSIDSVAASDLAASCDLLGTRE
jgi:hypothetical protein